MTASIKTFFAAALASAITMSPALADYTILEDSSLPSVLFIEFDGIIGDTSVINAPSAPVDDSALDRSEEDGSSSSDSSDTESSSASDDSGLSVEDRVRQRIAELEADSPESVEDVVIDNAIEERILEEADLR